jgi:hypothetical protein
MQLRRLELLGERWLKPRLSSNTPRQLPELAFGNRSGPAFCPDFWRGRFAA